MPTLRSTYRSVLDLLPAPVRLSIRKARGYMNDHTRRTTQRQAELFEKAGRPERVAQGPFAGMVYPFRNRNPLGNHLTNLLGIYELEIFPAIEAMVAAQPDVIVDVGSGEGYFAIGMARRCPQARVIGFDMSPVSRYLLGRNAALNGVAGRIEQRDKCEVEGLRDALAGAARPALICDCEGYEDVLLDPAAIPDLKRTNILVEVHETELLVDPGDEFWRSQFTSGVSARLRERFAATHEIDTIHERERTPADKPAGCGLSDAEFVEAGTELRGLRGLWFWMRAKGE